jgi:hypothetical protein
MQQQVVYRTREMQRIEAREGRPMDELLRELYLEQEQTVDQIAARFGLTKGAISRWLTTFGIEARPTSWRRKAAV